nr:hypothetical protein [Angustibacter aerolatus]
MPASPTYPFTAVVGADDLRLALLLSAVSPAVGGVLVRGEKGTAKSTMVRALAALLPPVAVVDGCRFSCDPADPDPACPDGPHDLSRAAGAHERPARLVEPAGRRHRGPRARLAAPRARTGPGRRGVRAGAAGRRPPRPALRRRGQPAGRPPGRRAARRRRDGPLDGRARGRVGLPRRALRARRHHEPRGGRAAPAACSTASA